MLFSGPMVRAILDGRKTQTRRVVKPQPRWVEADNAYHAGGGFRGTEGWRYEGGSRKAPIDFTWASDEAPSLDATACPYGQPGDRLWVRETFWPRPDRTREQMRNGADTWPRVIYDMEGPDVEELRSWGWKKTPSIHMPRWASRLSLEVTGVRVERLQAITAEGVEAEGWRSSTPEALVPGFAEFWDSLNASRGFGWDANPWVWVVEFQVVA